MLYTGADVAIKIQSQSVSATGFTTTTQDNKTYQIFDISKQILDKNYAVVVKNDGVIVDIGFKVNYLAGQVIFDTTDISRTISIDAHYFPAATLAYANVADIKMQKDIKEVPVFGMIYKNKRVGQKYAAGQLSNWHTVNEDLENLLDSSEPVIFEYDLGGKLIRMYALVDSEEVKANATESQEQTISFVVTDTLYKINKGV